MPLREVRCDLAVQSNLTPQELQQFIWDYCQDASQWA